MLVDKKNDNLIDHFSVKSVADFFFGKISSFQKIYEDFEHLLPENDYANFSNLQKIGEATFNDESDLLVFTCKFQGVLSERSSKKRQFEIAKKVLKEDFKDGAIFIFYDDNDCFRFSFIRKNYGNKDQKFTNWKRYTYFIDPKATNKTFKDRIEKCNFSSLEDIQDAFSVEKLNKKFYEEIATTFYSLIGGKVSINKKEVSFNSCLQLPSTPVEDKENRVKYQEFAVRLIGRTIFCWFLKNKKSENGVPLIPEEWLSSNMVASVNNDQHNYYHSILEKLFFLILNKKHEDRKPYILPNNHQFVPFLNGGLFEAQDDDFFPKDSKGFNNENFALNIPNDWFLKFFETLEQYNFTIDENSINDFEVSIDPEMLGTIFENLLAEIDPDTEKSARKSTGSFYTPREIVDYMVEQSLLQYIKTKTNIEDEEQLEVLLKDDAENPFNEKETIAILEALSDVKILDPACGSGAFPMGVLHKIIGLLKKLDKNAVWWKAKQLEKIDNAIMRKIMEEKLSTSTSDYARKLGVIQHSIYGVDIQPIAAEISKLRSFLSLIIDENIDDTAENRGIIPLPNLEFKFVTANTLIGLAEENKNGQTKADFGENKEILDELQKIRTEYLQANPSEKDEIKKRFKKVQDKINRTGNTNNLSNRESQLYHWKPFSNETSKWFDPEWMFGVEKFDVVIGNPPYGAKLTSEDKKLFYNTYKHQDYQLDTYLLFTEKSFQFLKQNGLNAFIIPNTWLINLKLEKFRKYIVEENTVLNIVHYHKNVFENAVVDTQVVIFKNQKSKDNLVEINEYVEIYNPIISTINQEKWKKLNGEPINIFITENTQQIIDKMKIISIPLDNICDVVNGMKPYEIGKGTPEQTKNMVVERVYDAEYKVDASYSELLRGRDINKYVTLWDGKRWIKYGDNLGAPRYSANFDLPEKIVIRQTSDRLIATLDTQKFVCMNNLHIINPKDTNYSLKYILAIINSRLMDFYYETLNPEKGEALAEVKKLNVEKLLIKEIEISNQQPFISLVDQILSNKKENIDTTDLETQIDTMVYKLYELTYAEVLVVEQDFGLSKQEYDNFAI